MSQDPQDPMGHVWNRACDALADGLPSDARVGDAMLMHAIAFDGWVHNGGLLDRVQVEDEESLDPAIEALRWFGLLEAATRVERVRDEWRRLSEARGLRSRKLDALEHEADRLYFEMPQGEVTDQLEAALAARLADEPAAFSPL